LAVAGHRHIGSLELLGELAFGFAARLVGGVDGDSACWVSDDPQASKPGGGSKRKGGRTLLALNQLAAAS
jgi:hypothetical protein